MALKDLLELSTSKSVTKNGISEQRIEAQLPIIRQYVAY